MRSNKNNKITSKIVLLRDGNRLKMETFNQPISKKHQDFVKINEDFLNRLMEEKNQVRITVLPITSNQKALWFLHQMDPDNISYNVSVAGKIRDPFDPAIFKRAIKLLSDRHIMLRSFFLNIPGTEPSVFQIVLDKVTPFVEDVIAGDMTPERVEQLINAKYKISFDLRNGPLFKTYLFYNNSFTYFLVNLHHIICDASSLKVLINELFRIYDSLSAGQNPDLKPVEVDFSDFIFEQEKFLAGKSGRAKLEFWKNCLQDKDYQLDLPYDYPRPALQTFNGATYHFTISGQLFKDLNKTALILNVTPNAVLYTVFELLLSKLSSQRQFYIGVPFSGRTRKEFEDLFGYLINTLPIKSNLQPGIKISDIVLQNRDKLNAALKNQEIPFSAIVESVTPRRDPSRSVVFQVLYNFMNKRTIGKLIDLWNPSGDEFRKFGTIEISGFAIDSQEGQFDLTLEILHQADEFTCVFKYNTDLFKLNTIEYFQQEYIGLLNTIISDPDSIPSWFDGSEKKPVKKKISINATGTFTIEPISPCMDFWMETMNMDAEINFLGYNQVFQQLFNPGSEFNLNRDGFNILLIRLEDLSPSVRKKVRSVKESEPFSEFSKALSYASEINPKGKYIVIFCPESDEITKKPESLKLIRKWENRITDQFRDAQNIFFISSEETIEKYSVTDYFEPLGEVHGHIPYTEDFYISLATLLSRKISNFYRLPVKAIAVDCDNTLWKGIVGEDGYMGIKIGRAEIAIQKFLLHQHSEGILICLCSKNNEDDVFEVFEKNTEMILKRENISFARINWLPKSQNLISLCKEINIGIDSFVLIDDSVSECDEVRSNAPQVITLQKPENDLNADFLKNSWIFDKVKITDEDKIRSKRYKEESVRLKYRSSVDSYMDFISGLQIQTDIQSFRVNDIPRISQLTFRTNQFNFTTIRRDESEIKQLSDNPRYDCLQINVSDRFGEYGLTGVIIADKKRGYVIDTFLLSCRILGKGVEHKLIRYLGTTASQNNSEMLEIHFRKTSKNTPAELFLEQNFGTFKQMAGEDIKYLIPVPVVMNFTFVPSLVKEEQFDESPEKKSDLKSDQVIELRNALCYNVVNNYLSIEKIKKAFKKSSDIQLDGASSYVKNDSGKTGQIISTIWREALDRNDIKPTDNFFEIGGHSVLIPQIVINLEKRHNIKIKIVDIFQYPTIKDLSEYIDGSGKSFAIQESEKRSERNIRSTDIAIIGMAGKFPGTEDINEFWDTIQTGREELTEYSREILENKGVKKSFLDHKDYIYASPVLKSGDKFDAAFFGFTPKEADFMDPQHRVFLEICYEAIENAGYRQADSRHSIGVFGGCGMNNYLIKNLLNHPETKGSIGEMLTIINNNSDYMTTRVSYKLNLRGPSIDVQTACSTSLVAVHLACQSLINMECKIALAGGAVINVPHDEGFLYEPGGILSPDGHCRPFDRNANGTLFGEGAGAVVLKRLEDAVNDNDTILAIIKGSAINNDGSHKVGYMAPGIQGQSEVIKAAIEKASVNPETITYIETHGTGTKMGDPIEIAAITKAYRNYTAKNNFCALGSVKGNIGHLDAAAGIAGLIKTVLLLKNKKLPPLTNFTEVNPELYIENTPFFINRTLSDWVSPGSLPRRAGVSSFGIGGTNAHCIIEEAPENEKSTSNRKYHLLPLSAKTNSGLIRQSDNLLKYLNNTSENIADIAFTLQHGRETFNNRLLVFGRNNSESINSLIEKSSHFISGEAKLSDPKIAFMFTGQGSQYVGMARDLYNDFELFRNYVNEAKSVLSGYGIDVLKYIAGDSSEEAEKEINQTYIAQPLLFLIQFSIVKLIEEFGINPDYLIGHSIGEITAACISGVFTFREGLIISGERGKIMQAQKQGAMIAIRLSPELLKPFLDGKAEISLYNAPEFCVVSGDFEEIEKLNENIKSRFPNVFTSRLKTSHAFHSYLIEPAVEEFTNFISSFELKEPQIPIISNISGSWATKEEMQYPQYWGNQIRKPVNFVGGINELLKDENTYFFEVGPGNSLTTLLSEFPKSKKNQISPILRHPKEKLNDTDYFLRSVGKAWTIGVSIDWSRYYKNEIRSRIPLPSYPFERTRHWIYPKEIAGLPETDGIGINKPESEGLPGDDKFNVNNLVHLDRSGLESDYVPPSTDLEKRLVALWEEILGTHGIGITDDFFQIGGHSLLAAQVINRINDNFQARVTIESFFKNPTIHGLGLTDVPEKESVKEAGQTEKLDYTSALPLSPSQERLWIINQIDNNNPAYNISFSYVLKGELNKKVFQQAINHIFNRHKVLKSYIRDEENGPIAYINQDTEIPIMEKDFSSILDEELDIKVQEFFENESRTSFDIQNGPLYRIFLIKQRNEETLFHFTIHHLIFDGWSWGVFTKELNEIYDSMLAGKDYELNPLPYDYFVYSELTRNENLNEKFKSSLDYWKGKLDGISGLLNFPLDFNRREISSGEGSRVPMVLGLELSNKLIKFAKDENVTLFMYLISAFGVLLNRYTGDKEICIGSPTANRSSSELEKLIGLFINSIVIRLDIEDNLTFRDLLKLVKQNTIEAITHQELPFEVLVENLNPERLVNINPIFQVMFAMQNAPRPPLDLDGIHSDRYYHKNGVSPLDISFYVWEDKGSILGEIEFSTDIFKWDTINALKENYISILKRLILNPEILLKDLDIISELEKERLRVFNSTIASYPELAIHNIFENNITKFSDRIAVESKSGVISYSELDKQANQLANYLLSDGFTNNSIAGISMDRSVEMIITVLGVLKAGGCYLPLDPSFPDERLFYMLEDSGAKLLISESHYLERFENINIPKLIYHRDWNKIAKQSTIKPSFITDLNSFAYIIYTSGSTGKPKGVKVHHLAVTNFINSMSKTPGLTSDDKLLAVTTLSFDIAVLEIFLPLAQGATVFIAEGNDVSDGESLARIISDHNITTLQATPATWALLIASGWKGDRTLKGLCGGEALLPGLAKELLSNVGVLWNMYGPTETTVWSTCHKITDYKKILVGKPIDNTQVYILRDCKEQPIGVIGEVCIGGLGVTKGYHNREELSKQKFITWNGNVIYRTGDNGRFLDDGNIELLGRNDNQIKLHGYRIEPGEIEFNLCQVDGVKEAVVKLQKINEMDDRLIGFLHIDESFHLDRDQIIKHIGNKIPGYMIPSILIQMKEFPRTLNGKIDKKALLYEGSNLIEEVDNDNDFSEVEHSLIEIWRDVLKVKNLRRDRSFFDVGGNSLLAIRLINRINEKFEFPLTFGSLLNNSSISQLATLIENIKAKSESKIKLVHLTNFKNLPLTMNQKRLWLIAKLQPEIPSYIVPFTYKLLGYLNIELFQRSLEILFDRHHIVFSVIKEIGNVPYCDIVPSKPRISILNHIGLPEEENTRLLNDLVNSDSRRAFDLEQGPLYRLFLIKSRDDEFYFHMSFHHIIFDGWSSGVFINDLSEIYNCLIKGVNVELEDLPFQQYDYAQWEASIDDRAESIAFWKGNLQGCSPILNFPYDYLRKEQSTGRGGFEVIKLSKSLSNKLRQISKEEGSSLFTILMSGFGVLMQKYSGDDDINIGSPIAYRPHSMLEKVFGMFVDTVVIRLRYSKDITFREHLKKSNEAVLNAISHQDLPFEKVVEIVNPDRAINVNPLFQVAFDWQNDLSIPFKLNGIRSERITGDARGSIFDLTLSLFENGDIIEGEIEYNIEIIKPETAARLKNHFITLLNSLTENLNTPISSISLISEEEIRIISSVNNTHINYPKDKTIVQLFEDQVRLYPNKTAVVFKGSSISYKQLNEKTNQLARVLRAKGVKANTPVGLFIDKSVDMIVGIFGILKSGGGYVPIDPEFPEQRINFIIKDSGCKILISQKKYDKVLVENIMKFNLDSSNTYHKDKSNVEGINASTDLAYIIYTSGTTGTPKGSLIPHRGVVRLVRDTNYIEFTAKDRVLQTASIVFDASVEEIFGALLNGGTLYVVDKETLLDPDALGDVLLKNDITIVDMASALFTQIAESRTDIFRKVKSLILGGDVLSAPHVNKVRKDNPELTVINTYGPTENSCDSTFYIIDRDFDYNIPIGKPISNSTAYIFDKYMNYQPIGIIGELYVGGDGLSKGYLNRDELNRASFIENPNNPGEKLYKTGDLARWLPDGNLEFHGRIDNQLKIRGFRVELEEIESIISEVDGVIETIIKPVKVEEGDYRLVAFLNVPETFSMDTKELVSIIRSKLPSYMVPSAYRFMHGFARTVNGKIDRKSLHFDINELKEKEEKEEKEIIELTEDERTIFEIWKEALKLDQIEVTDNFFEVGGNSLMAISVMSKIKSAFNVELKLRHFFDSPRIKDLAEIIKVELMISEKPDALQKKVNKELKIIKGEL